jgi:NDP-sugar pyrophosphorylase family protein
MKAMVLAAGLATRLRPLTDTRPKALVEIGGRTLLEITLQRLQAFGVTEVIVNAHHFADRIVDYVALNRNFGMRIEVSREEILLDTGGGLKKAAWFFLEDGRDRDQPFVLHNVDVRSNIDLEAMLRFHRERQALVSLAVQKRETSRYLLFDEQGQLRGRRLEREEHAETIRSGSLQALAFCGIHVISPRLLEMMSEEGVFSIIETYLRLAVRDEPILAFRADEFYWRDLGTMDSLARAVQELTYYPVGGEN